MLVQKLGSNKHVKDIRGAGLIIGIELEVSASSLVDKCWKSGLLVLTAEKGNVVRLVPPLIITELASATEILVSCMSTGGRQLDLDANSRILHLLYLLYDCVLWHCKCLECVIYIKR
ncbi:hypothetical protein LIER_41531 [Lithospermum erythrorhizon]|uniref:Ornithine aminotransferase n=1 Tax=Lithospermum erythrorhizon TaxID=34254 RepID=A0AAV3REV6_LITER